MTQEEALGELGVGPDTSPDMVRRAYLRLLKTRKPEVDPQGFARLREAYDFLKAVQEGTEAPRTQAAPAVPAPSPAPADPTFPQTSEQRLEVFRHAFRTLPADAPPELPVQVAREAVEALPEAAEARHWLIQALMAANRKDEAIQAFRDAFQQGHPEFLLGFAERFPQHLSQAELQLLGSLAPHTFLWGLADHYKEVGDWARAGAVALVALEAMKRNPEKPPPEPAWFLSTILLLHENGRPQEAREIQRRYATWVEAEGLVDAFKVDSVAWAWPLILELGVLDDAFAPEVRAVLAHAVLTSETDEAKARLQAWRRQEPARADEALGLLKAHCPRFQSVLGEALGPGFVAPSADPAPAAPKAESSTGWFGRILATLGVLALLMVVLAVPTVIRSLDPSQPPPPRARESVDRAQARSAMRAAAKALCAELPTNLQGIGCNHLEQVIRSTEANDCVPVAVHYPQMMAQLRANLTNQDAYMHTDGEAKRERISRARASLEASIRELCPKAL